MSRAAGRGSAPGHPPAQASLEAEKQRGRFAVLLELPGPLESHPLQAAATAPGAAGTQEEPDGAWQQDGPAEGHWERYLWFRFEVRVAGWGLVWEARRLVDVVVDPATEKPMVLQGKGEGRPGPAGRIALPGPVPVLAAPEGLAWVSDYELARFGQVALDAAVAVAQREAGRLGQAMQPLYEAEAERLASYYARRRGEVLFAAMGSLRQMEQASALAMLGPMGLHSRTGARVAQLVNLAAARWQLAREALAAVEEESRRAMAELQARSRPTATLCPAGVAVLWGPASTKAPCGAGRARARNEHDGPWT